MHTRQPLNGRPALLALLAFLLLPGCRHFDPQPMDSARSLEQLERRSLDDEGLREFVAAHRQPGTTGWNLESLTLAALYFHPSLDLARASVAVAEAGKVTAGQRPNPTLSVAPQYDVTTTIPSPWIVAPALSVPVETAGKRAKRIALATRLAEAARWEIAATAWNVRAELRRALLEFWSAEEAARAWGDRLAAQEEMLRLQEGRLQAGDATPIEVSRERVTLEQTRLAQMEARNRRLTARVQLATAIGLPPRALDGVEFSYDAFTRPPAELPPAEARRRALLNRADVLGALAQYAASEAALHLEIARQYPDIKLSPNYQFDQGDHMWGLGISVELPLLNQNQGPIAEAEARRRQQAAKFLSLQARVLGEIETALAGYDTAREQLTAAARVLTQLDEQERRVRAMFQAGEVSRQAVAAARVERTAAALAQLDARLKAQEALGRLENALQLPADLPASALETPRPLTLR
jgi:outer membrane protein TolC